MGNRRRVSVGLQMQSDEASSREIEFPCSAANLAILPTCNVTARDFAD
jgi:hypothetical protein